MVIRTLEHIKVITITANVRNFLLYIFLVGVLCVFTLAHVLTWRGWDL